jgi:hypothetical protein
MKSVFVGAIVLFLAILPGMGETAVPVINKAYDGVYCLPAGEAPGQPVNLQSSPWQSSFITGMALRSQWTMIQPNKGVYSWTLFDQGLALAQKNNKMISLSVAAGGFCPSWLIYEGASYITITIQTAFLPQPQKMQMVLPWDPVFQKEWASLVQAMATRYDGSPNVGYVYIGGPGTYIETFLIQNQQDYNTFNAAGGLTKWIQGTEAIIDMYGSSFKNTPFLLALGNPVASIPSAQAAGEDAVEEVVNYGMTKYPGRFGVANHGLNANSNSPTAYNGANYFVNQLISQNAATSPVGFQMVSAASGGGPTWNLGDLGTAVSAGIQLGAEYIEVYKIDCMNSKYTQMLTQANTQLKQN